MLSEQAVKQNCYYVKKQALLTVVQHGVKESWWTWNKGWECKSDGLAAAAFLEGLPAPLSENGGDSGAGGVGRDPRRGRKDRSSTGSGTQAGSDQGSQSPTRARPLQRRRTHAGRGYEKAPWVPQGARPGAGFPASRGTVGVPGSREPPPGLPGGPPRHGGCAPGLRRRAGEEPGGWLLGRAELPAPARCLPHAGPRRAAPHLPLQLRRSPQASGLAHYRPPADHDGWSACLFKSGSLSWRQHAGARTEAAAALPVPAPVCHVDHSHSLPAL
ncbi:uncharacterized protein [Chlorocebus sabaeus]|uniref:uncharacterized protein n=1 Tax=Chlorocebus sabaeus TaxID=60711 RepID=UPI003BF9EF59